MFLQFTVLAPVLGVSASVLGLWIGSALILGRWIAYIHWIADVREDSVGLISFQKLGAHEFIDVFAIDHCVGVFQIKTT
ncbi:hypothetical protein RirG_125590 [Rhizophagus irregularis DAOM 197198w]|uniref:Uncharacterized protein n=1 Tax=Rhizophagus irregularis (strain DAOM 197198w) TaxID=1432141 RepID=A0A015KFN6_RHIIW|nr:hypothetical protein RirG_125590 [Rhizophagus irregularis DAOM 197198w]